MGVGGRVAVARRGVMVLMGVMVATAVVVTAGSTSLVAVGDNTKGSVGGTASTPPSGAAINAAMPMQ